jgi:mRNA interferase MazF
MKQGEIWLVQLYPTIGAEINKTRPCIIINEDNIGTLPLRIIVPITDWKERYEKYPWMIKIIPNEQNGLTKVSSIDCFQVRSISTERLVKSIGIISETIVSHIQNAIGLVIGID